MSQEYISRVSGLNPDQSHLGKNDGYEVDSAKALARHILT